MSELDFDPEFVKQEMWNEKKYKSGGNCARCGRCGSAVSWRCRCAKKRFIDRITDQQAYEYLNKKCEREKKEYERLIEEKKKEIDELTKKLQKFQFT
jgi:hypothetical protein